MEILRTEYFCLVFEISDLARPVSCPALGSSCDANLECDIFPFGFLLHAEAKKQLIEVGFLSLVMTSWRLFGAICPWRLYRQPVALCALVLTFFIYPFRIEAPRERLHR